MNELLQPLYELYVSVFGRLPESVEPYFKPVVFVLLSFLIGLLIRRVFVARLKKIAEHTENFYDDIVVDALRRRTVLWVVLIAAILAVPTLPWDPADAHSLEQILMGIFVLTITIAAVKAYSQSVQRYSEHSGTGVGGTTLIRYIGASVLYAVGGVIILSLFDISVLPAITALGVGGLAVALAFQDTLANIFAGVHITLTKQVRTGDYVQMKGGEEGFVEDISWRTTSMRTLANNLVIIPNKKLAESVLINYSLPQPRLGVELSVSVSYDTDPAMVEEILVDEVTKAHGEVPGVIDEPPPVRFVEFAESSLKINVYAQIDNVELRYAARHELMKRIYRRFKEEGITIPFPIRTLYLHDQTNGKEQGPTRLKTSGVGDQRIDDAGTEVDEQ